jgi:proteasome activator subunit 4
MSATNDFDRHKTRAMWEFIAGLIRGSEDWSGKDRSALWTWMAPKLPELFGAIRHDTTKCWDVALEYILYERDPRRIPELMDFLITTAKNADFANGSSFDCAFFCSLLRSSSLADPTVTRRVQIVRSLVRCFQWNFSAWADDFIDLYFAAADCPYAEVRGLISALLNALDQLKVCI